jgi:ketosteroid isomerase-like protein
LRDAQSAQGGTAVERALAAYLSRVQARDLAGMRGVLTEDVIVTDHRALGVPPAQGPDEAAALTATALGVTSELRFEIDETMARAEHALAGRGAWLGKAAEGIGQGEVAVPMALVVFERDGKLASIDLYEPHDDAIDRRFEALTSTSLGP